MKDQNYQKELDELIKANSQNDKTPSLLLHSCCGPCSAYVLDYLSKHFSITLFYYNPNILPEEEYKKRLQAQKQLLDLLEVKNPVRFIEGCYDSEKFLSAVKGFEDEPEGGKRCDICFRLRLEETAKLAKKLNCGYFSTTLSVSPHKNAGVLSEISSRVSADYGVKALPADFKKRGGYQNSVRLAREYGLYRQNYCGCPFSF